MNTKQVCAATVVFASLLLVPSEAKPPPGKGPNKISHTASQDLPIQLGTSGGWADDLANGYCCGGTLGSLIRLNDGLGPDGMGSVHILSNFHVLAADVVEGGNGIVAEEIDPIIQPGLIDVQCNKADAQIVALISGAADPLGTGTPKVDAAIAQVWEGAVDPDGAILEIGPVAKTTLLATLGQAVKKSGRTTGLTHSTIAYLDVSVSVAYEDECAGNARGTATFTGQIVANNSGNSFLNGGDSGSLMVEDVSSAPRAVGLLFAGSSLYAIANPIDDVLDRFNATMVGVEPSTETDPGTGDASGPGKGNGRGKPKSAQAINRARSVHSNNGALLNGVGRSNGHGIGVDANGDPFIAVFVETLSDAPANVPTSIDGIPVRVVEIGHVVAY